MKSLENNYREEIKSDSIQKVRDDYIKHDYNYYKVTIKNSEDLLCVLDSIPRKI
jgi:hypothetical protein